MRVYAGETIGFSNTPLTDVTITVNYVRSTAVLRRRSTARRPPNPHGLDASSDANGDISSNTELGLEPQTLTCTIVIDP